MSKRWIKIRVNLTMDVFCEPKRDEVIVAALTANVPPYLIHGELVDEMRVDTSADEAPR